jgi:hypothetical protein
MGCAQSRPIETPPTMTTVPPPSTEIVLPRIRNRLPELDAGWEQWGLDDLMGWARTMIRNKQNQNSQQVHQNAIAIMVLSEATGATIHLLHEGIGRNGEIVGDAAEIRVTHGDTRFSFLLDGKCKTKEIERRGLGYKLVLKGSYASAFFLFFFCFFVLQVCGVHTHISAYL